MLPYWIASLLSNYRMKTGLNRLVLNTLTCVSTCSEFLANWDETGWNIIYREFPFMFKYTSNVYIIYDI